MAKYKRYNQKKKYIRKDNTRKLNNFPYWAEALEFSDKTRVKKQLRDITIENAEDIIVYSDRTRYAGWDWN